MDRARMADNAVAWVAIYLGAASLLAIAGVVIVLAIAPHIQ